MNKDIKGKKKEIVSTLNMLIGIGISILIIGIGRLLFSEEERKLIFLEDRVEGFLIIILFVTTLIWGILYFYTVYKELRLLKYYLNVKYISPISLEVFIDAIFLSACFGGLLVFFNILEYYIICAIFLEIFDVWGWTIIRKNIFNEYISEIKENKNRDKKENKKKDELGKYYLYNPIAFRSSIIMVLFFLSYILLTQYGNKYASYLIMILTILISNAVIELIWRRKRDKIIYNKRKFPF